MLQCRRCRGGVRSAVVETTVHAAFMESDRQKVTLLLLAAELAMTERCRQLPDCPEHHEERNELAVAKAALETIRFRKLGWPPVAPS